MGNEIDTSQNGQSAYVYELFGGYDVVRSMDGFVVEIGAFDGVENSNAYPLYGFGWHGISVEPDPISFGKLQKLHFDNDKVQTVSICLHDTKPGIVEFYGVNPNLPFNDRQLSSLSKQFADKVNIERSTEAIVVRKLALRLHHFYEAFINRKVDYLSMDCECYDEKILCANDFTKFKPTVIQAELQYDTEIESVGLAKRTAKYLEDNGYIVKRFPSGSDILAVDVNANHLNLGILNTMDSV